MANKKPGIIIPFDNFQNRAILKKISGFKATCSVASASEIKIKVELELTMDGYLKESEFDPATTPNPDGEKTIYLPFDDVANKAITYISAKRFLKVTDDDPGSSPVTLGIDFIYFGKTRWGKTRWGLNNDFDNLF